MSARILIVDDNPASVKLLEAKLSREYYDVISADKGRDALKAVAEDAPDVILLDVMMPGMDGFDVCRQIKKNPKTTHIPVVMITALGGRDDRAAGLQAGADDFLTKPVDDTTLFARVRSLVRLKRMLEQWRLREETSEKLGFQPDGVEIIDSGTEGHIVLVDDSTVQKANISEALSADNDRVSIVEDYQASGQIADLDGDVVVISLTTDVDAAMRLASRLRSIEQTRQVPILMIGEVEDLGHFIKALELGVNDYLMRPIDDQELIARVRTQIRRKRYQDRLQANFLQHLSMALTDGLTGLHNRRYFSTHLESVMNRLRQGGDQPVSLLMIDIDHFKAVNDTYGHAAGDKVLHEVALRILRNIRGFDLAARYGGEEFVVVMPDTPIEVALAVADRLRGKMASEPVALSDSMDKITVTLSIGVAVSHKGVKTSEDMLKEADEAMYEAKRQGRNQVVPKPAADAWITSEVLPG